MEKNFKLIFLVLGFGLSYFAAAQASEIGKRQGSADIYFVNVSKPTASDNFLSTLIELLTKDNDPF